MNPPWNAQNPDDYERITRAQLKYWQAYHAPPKKEWEPKSGRPRRKPKKAIIYPDGYEPEVADFDVQTPMEAYLRREVLRLELVAVWERESRECVIRQFQLQYQGEVSNTSMVWNEELKQWEFY